MQEESELVTGEAVVLELRVAKLASRALAMALDVLLQLALLFGSLLLLVIAVSPDDESLALTIFLVLLVLVMVGYPVTFETLSRGRTLGKMAMGLRVVRVDGGPIRFRHALTRGLAGFVVDFWALGMFGAVGLIVSLVSSNGRRVGDYLAGTLVIRERVAAAPGYAAIGMPPGLAGWAAQLDLSRLPDDLALASRQFLGRFGELRPEAAHSLGYGLAQQVANQLGTPIPAGVPAWAFLAAVLAERRNRDHARAVQAYAQARPAPGYAPQGYPQQTYSQQTYPQQGSAQQGYPTGYQQAPQYGQPVPTASPYAPPAFAESSQAPSVPPEPVENPFTPPS